MLRAIVASVLLATGASTVLGQAPSATRYEPPVTSYENLPYAAALASDLDAPPVPREFRGVWIATVDNIDWPSKPGLPVEI